MIEFLFVEIIPGTEKIERFLNLDTGKFEEGPCVGVNIYQGISHKFETMSKIANDSWPLQWFRLNTVPLVPDDPYDAWNRAFSIIGN